MKTRDSVVVAQNFNDEFDLKTEMIEGNFIRFRYNTKYIPEVIGNVLCDALQKNIGTSSN